MKNIFLTLLFLTFTISLSAQGIKIPKDTTAYQYKKIAEFQQDDYNPIIFIDNKIGDFNSVSNLVEVEQIESITVIKKPSQDFPHPNLTATGVVLIHMKSPLQLPIKKISEINQFFMLDKDNPIYLNGYLVEDQSLEFYTDAIKEIEKVMPSQENNLQGEVLNIRTFSREEVRKNPVVSTCSMLPK